MPSLALVQAHALTLEMLDDLPVFMRDDVDVQGIIYCQAKEHERLREHIDRVRRSLFPQHADELGMRWWEALLLLPIEPEGQTLEQRRETVMIYLGALRAAGTGRWWVDTVTRLLGPGWTYEEHIEGDVGTPAAYTLRVTVPFATDSERFLALEALLEQITDAHIDVIADSSTTFHLDQSQLDQDPFGI